MQKTMRRAIALMMCAVVISPGCATMRVPAQTADYTRQADAAVLADYVQRLPPGSFVKVERAGGRTLRGTLMKATGSTVVVQPRTRIPEPPVEVALSEVLNVVPDTPPTANIAKAIVAGAAAGAGAALAMFFIILSAYD
jgi:hypothetical protein